MSLLISALILLPLGYAEWRWHLLWKFVLWVNATRWRLTAYWAMWIALYIWTALRGAWFAWFAVAMALTIVVSRWVGHYKAGIK